VRELERRIARIELKVVPDTRLRATQQQEGGECAGMIKAKFADIDRELKEHGREAHYHAAIQPGAARAAWQGDKASLTVAQDGGSLHGHVPGHLLHEWLPTGGKNDWRNLVMPSLALGWYFAASLLRLTRSSMLEVMRSEYIKLARLKGLPGYVVIAKHGFKNALVTVLTLAGLNLVVMVNAAVIIEVIFAWPGIGRLLYEGIFQRDFPLVQVVVVLAGVMIVFVNLLIDILYAYIDPRIRLTK
jgi:hypothetical protein